VGGGLTVPHGTAVGWVGPRAAAALAAPPAAEG